MTKDFEEAPFIDIPDEDPVFSVEGWTPSLTDRVFGPRSALGKFFSDSKADAYRILGKMSEGDGPAAKISRFLELDDYCVNQTIVNKTGSIEEHTAPSFRL